MKRKLEEQARRIQTLEAEKADLAKDKATLSEKLSIMQLNGKQGSIRQQFIGFRFVRLRNRAAGESKAKARKRSIDKNYRQGVEVDAKNRPSLTFFLLFMVSMHQKDSFKL